MPGLTRKKSLHFPSKPKRKTVRRALSDPNQNNHFSSPEYTFSPLLFTPKPKKTRRWFSNPSPNSPYTYEHVLVPNNIKHNENMAIGYQMKKFSNNEARQLMKNHLDKYIKLHPAATYEEWIINFLPENFKGYTPSGEIKIDYRLHTPTAESVRMWRNKKKQIRKQRLIPDWTLVN
jgi:hypothetical protein